MFIVFNFPYLSFSQLKVQEALRKKERFQREHEQVSISSCFL